MGAVASPLFVAVLWVWALVGYGRLVRTSEAALYRRRAFSASLALGLCFVLAGLATPEVGLLPAVVTAPLAAFACLLHGVLEPTRAGLWHHRRLRPLGGLALVVLGVLLAVASPRPDAAALAFAAAILHHHLATGARLQARMAAEVDELRVKLLSGAAAARLPMGLSVHLGEAEAAEADSPGDKGQWAG